MRMMAEQRSCVLVEFLLGLALVVADVAYGGAGVSENNLVLTQGQLDIT